MRTRRRVLARPCVAASVFVAAACRDATPPEDGVRSGRAEFQITRSGVTLHSASVVGSMDLVVRPSGGTAIPVMSRSLSAYDTSVVFPMTVPNGDATFVARVLSNNGTVLFADSVTQRIAGDGFRVAMSLKAQRPVMIVTPDTLHVPSSLPNTGVFPVLVQNHGLTGLTWRVAQADVGLAFRPTSGTAPPPLAIDTLRVIVGFNATRPASFVLSSAEGNVRIVIVSP